MSFIFITSLTTTLIMAFSKFMLLFLINTNRPFLLVIPLIAVIAGFFCFKLIINKLTDIKTAKAIALIIILPVFLAMMIVVSVIGIVSAV